MTYLFFDIECANCFDDVCKMYSFGYVKTNENLKEIKMEDIVINPNVDKWDWYVLKNFLTYDKKVVESEAKFDCHYPNIKTLLELDNQIAFGFDIINDIKFLVNDCKRYNLEYIKFKYIDIKDMINKLENRQVSSLASEYLKLTLKLPSNIHRSDVDSFYTKEIMFELLKKHGKEKMDNYINENIKCISDLDLEVFNTSKKTKKKLELQTV